jgi:4-diphosphocytidyl-2C-methyl-D-erythritol kinase
MQERWSGMEAAVAAAREDADSATAAAAKAEADLAALSTAYNGLEQHAFEMEEQLRQLQEQQQGSAAAAAAVAAGAGAAADGIIEAAVQARIQAALEEVSLRGIGYGLDYIKQHDTGTCCAAPIQLCDLCEQMLEGSSAGS